MSMNDIYDSIEVIKPILVDKYLSAADGAGLIFYPI